MHNQPPPPYQPPQPYSIHATIAQSYGAQQNHCPIHRRQPCTCLHNAREVNIPRIYSVPSATKFINLFENEQSMSPASGTGMSPSYPHSEPSPDPMGSYNPALLNTCIAQRTASDSSPTPQNNNNNNSSLGLHLIGISEI